LLPKSRTDGCRGARKRHREMKWKIGTPIGRQERRKITKRKRVKTRHNVPEEMHPSKIRKAFEAYKSRGRFTNELNRLRLHGWPSLVLKRGKNRENHRAAGHLKRRFQEGHLREAEKKKKGTATPDIETERRIQKVGGGDGEGTIGRPL